MGFIEMLFFYRGWAREKFWHTAMADGATD